MGVAEMTAAARTLEAGHCLGHTLTGRCGAWRLRWTGRPWPPCWRCGDRWPPQPDHPAEPTPTEV